MMKGDLKRQWPQSNRGIHSEADNNLRLRDRQYGWILAKTKDKFFSVIENDDGKKH